MSDDIRYNVEITNDINNENKDKDNICNIRLNSNVAISINRGSYGNSNLRNDDTNDDTSFIMIMITIAIKRMMTEMIRSKDCIIINNAKRHDLNLN